MAYGFYACDKRNTICTCNQTVFSSAPFAGINHKLGKMQSQQFFSFSRRAMRKKNRCTEPNYTFRLMCPICGVSVDFDMHFLRPAFLFFFPFILSFFLFSVTAFCMQIIHSTEMIINKSMYIWSTFDTATGTRSK